MGGGRPCLAAHMLLDIHFLPAYSWHVDQSALILHFLCFLPAGIKQISKSHLRWQNLNRLFSLTMHRPFATNCQSTQPFLLKDAVFLTLKVVQIGTE